jgi:hypothetical protein
MSLAEAREAERQGRIEEAASLYEVALRTGPRPLDALLDLAILYWQATEYGYWVGMNLSPDFVGHAGRRFAEVLSEAAREYPGSTEVEFWQHYIPWADLGESFPTETCARLLVRDPTVLTPAMYLLGEGQDEQYEQEARALLQQCHAGGTVRAQYIASVIEGVLKRRRGRKRN